MVFVESFDLQRVKLNRIILLESNKNIQNHEIVAEEKNLYGDVFKLIILLSYCTYFHI